jgi:membrane protein YqaA with SNARE-associated domain
MIHFKPFRFGKTEAILIAVSAAVIVMTFASATVPWVATWYADINRHWTNLAAHYGYTGAFVSAFVGSVTPVIVFPYTIVIFFLAAQGLNPWLLGLLMGLGAGFGQFSGYIIGVMSSRFLEKRKASYDALERLVRMRPWFMQWVLFLFAVTPLPDAVIFIPLGMLRYGWIKILVPTLAGKIVSGMLVTLSSRFLAHTLNIDAAASSTAIVSQFFSLLTVVGVVYVVLKLDWEKMMHRWFDPHGITSSPETPTDHAGTSRG